MSGAAGDAGNVAPPVSVRSQLRDLAVNVLLAAGTDAGQSVFGANAQPTGGSEMPVLLVQVPHERKANIANRGMPRFNTVMTLVVVGRVQGTTPNEVELAIDRLIDQVHAAILGSYDLLRFVQQFPEVETETVLTTSGRAVVGEAKIMILCEVYQPYSPPPGPPLTAIGLTLQFGGEDVAQADIVLPPAPDGA